MSELDRTDRPVPLAGSERPARGVNHRHPWGNRVALVECAVLALAAVLTVLTRQASWRAQLAHQPELVDLVPVQSHDRIHDPPVSQATGGQVPRSDGPPDGRRRAHRPCAVAPSWDPSPASWTFGSMAAAGSGPDMAFRADSTPEMKNS